MKINWHQNPLRTTFELSEAEKEAFRLKVRLELMEEAMAEAAFLLDRDESREHFSPDRALKELRAALPDDDGREPPRVHQQFVMLLHELENGRHCGDCTCRGISCGKCRAEQILGVDSTEGLGNHAGYQIDAAFGQNDERGIDQAIELLAAYDPVRGGLWLSLPEEDFTSNIPAWKAQAKTAHDWLVNYRADHFA